MKKMFVLIGSRKKGGNTTKFVNQIVDNLDKNKIQIEYSYPQDYKIGFCVGCDNCFINTECSLKDEITLLQNRILESDIFLIASPVYLHYMTADLKLVLDRSAWWAHTLRLQGKPVVVLTTCSSNGFNTALEPISKIMTYMGGNVIATANAAQIPNQINNRDWLDEVSKEIANRIMKYVYLPPQSNQFIERVFVSSKVAMLQQEEVEKTSKIEFGECAYWRRTGMIKYSTFKEYLEEQNKKVVKPNENSSSTTK